MESFVLTCDPVLQESARIAGFAEAMVQDTETGKVVLTRHRFSRQWAPYEHLAPGQCALDAFYGAAFWERPDVLARYRRQEDSKAASRLAVGDDISRDFRSDLRKQIRKRVDGKHDLLMAIAHQNMVKM